MCNTTELEACGEIPCNNGHNWTPKKIQEFAILFMEHLRKCMRSINELRNKASNKVYHYGITITRNPTDTDGDFLHKMTKWRNLTYFKNAVTYSWALEAYKTKETEEHKLNDKINDHIHIYVKSHNYLKVKDLKKSYTKNILQCNKLYGDKVVRTINYIKKDNNHQLTIDYYKKLGIDPHYGKSSDVPDELWI